MPNPINRVRRNASMHFSPGIITQYEPRLSLHFASVITAWASAESLVGRLLSAICRGDAHAIVEKAIGLRNSVAQRALLMDEARKRISDERLEYIEAIVALFVHQNRLRNIVVHWISGVSRDIPGAILFEDPKTHWRDMAEAQTGFAQRSGVPHPPPAFSKRSTLVFTAADFEQIAVQVDQIVRGLSLILHIMLLPDGFGTPEERARKLQKLHELPLIHAELERLRRLRQKP